jgi:hypothetical protein
MVESNTVSMFGSCGIIECPDPLTLTIILIAAAIFIGIYVYTALALKAIARKLNNSHGWIAWIPLVNFVLLLEFGEFHWALIFLFLVPILGWIALAVISVIALWRCCEKLNYPGWISLFSLLGSIPGLIILGILAWHRK